MEIMTKVLINAPVSKVWGILMRFDNYDQWNPFIKDVSGKLMNGEKIRVRFKLSGVREIGINSKVIVYRPERELRWKKKILMRWIFTSVHIFELKQEQDGNTAFSQRGRYKGILYSLFFKRYAHKAKEGFELMNLKLKELAETY
jgi:hypothetical protein